MADASESSSCSIFHYAYKGPKTDHNNSSPFTIHCTLEKGAEAYYSGVRVVVLAKKIGFHNSFAKMVNMIFVAIWDVILKIPRQEVQERTPLHKEDEDFIESEVQVFNIDLPLHAFIFELVDLSNERSSASEIRFIGAKSPVDSEPMQISDTYRVLYDCAKHTTVNAPSCSFLLTTQHDGLWRRRGRYHRLRSHFLPPMSLPTYGFRILPPPGGRTIFIQPPPEILYNIFSILAWDDASSKEWRKALIYASLVCRAWWKIALCVIYEDFSFERQEKINIRIERLATTLRNNPEWGRYIKRFSSTGFTNVNETTSDSGCTTAGGSVLTILRTASNIRRLSMGGVNIVLAEEFANALSKMTDVRYFTQFSAASRNGTELNAAQLAKCFAHWPRVRQATVYKFGEPRIDDEIEFVPAQCALNQITFFHGLVSIAQYRAITASSRDTLHIVSLSFIKGISNAELTSWLLDFGQNLTGLTLESCVFTRSETDELAVDATIHIMSKLSHLEVDNQVATHLLYLDSNPW